jgi:hypothetical protein
MAGMKVQPVDGSDGFAVGAQEIALSFDDGATEKLSCVYPAADVTWRQIALEKLETFAAGRCDPLRIVEVVENLEHEPDVSRLVGVLRRDDAVQATAI